MPDIKLLFPKENSQEAQMYLGLVRGQTPGLCKGAVSHSYVSQQTLDDTPDRLYIISEERRPTRHKAPFVTLYGFAMVYATNNAWYLDVICANKVGKFLIQRI